MLERLRRLPHIDRVNAHFIIRYIIEPAGGVEIPFGVAGLKVYAIDNVSLFYPNLPPDMAALRPAVMDYLERCARQAIRNGMLDERRMTGQVVIGNRLVYVRGADEIDYVRYAGQVELLRRQAEAGA